MKYCRSQVKNALNSRNSSSAAAIAISVLCVWWTIDLVDHHLREQRRCQPDQLQHQRGQQHVAPDGFVAQQLRYKPAETEAAGIVRRKVLVRRIRSVIAAHQQDPRLEMLRKVGERQRLAGG
jgi:hypothetical protein